MGVILMVHNDYYIEVMRDSDVEQYQKESFKSQMYWIFPPFMFQLAEKAECHPDWRALEEAILGSEKKIT